ncbi:MAG: Hsp70 family protein [Peptococcaceae bacterium]|nr:Hsp70 family protein [Peptococcaceae bacterium]
MSEERIIGMQIGSGNLALASYRVIGQFASSEVIRLSDGRGNYQLMPALFFFAQPGELEIGRAAKGKWLKQPELVYSPLQLLSGGVQQLTIGDYNLAVSELIGNLTADLREQAGLFGEFTHCSVAYPEYLNQTQLLELKQGLRADLPDLAEHNFVPSGVAALLDMQMHPARYNLGYHKFDFATKHTFLVVDVGENFTTTSLFHVCEVGEELQVRYLVEPQYIQLGGRDFDASFASHVIEQAKVAGNIVPGELTPELQRQIQLDADKLKRDLVERVDAEIISTHGASDRLQDLSVPLRILGPGGRKLVERDITKAEYDAAVFSCIASRHQAEACIFQPVTRALNLARLSPEDVDEVLLVGGMARLHCLGEVFKQAFCLVPREFRSPELAAARGASIYQDMITNALATG